MSLGLKLTYPDLPVARRREEILEAMKATKVVVAVTEGCGLWTAPQPAAAFGLAACCRPVLRGIRFSESGYSCENLRYLEVLGLILLYGEYGVISLLETAKSLDVVNLTTAGCLVEKRQQAARSPRKAAPPR